MRPTRHADLELRRHAGKIRTLLLEALHQSRIEIRQVKNPALVGLLELTGDVLDELRMAYAEFGAPVEPVKQLSS